MISLMEKQEIILSHYRYGKSQLDIHREKGIGRKTIRKYIKEYEKKKQNLFESCEENKELIENLVSAPKYDSSSRVRNINRRNVKNCNEEIRRYI
ncbi:MAG: hypothetical protein ACOWWR_16635 [Eubacteriales bacterium]